MASSWGHLDVVRLLLTEGADMAISDNGGRTAPDYVTQDTANCLRTGPCTMAIMALQELSIYYQLDASTIIDLWQYLDPAPISRKEPSE